jgi:hypothetical protein
MRVIDKEDFDSFRNAVFQGVTIDESGLEYRTFYRWLEKLKTEGFIIGSYKSGGKRSFVVIDKNNHKANGKRGKK